MEAYCVKCNRTKPKGTWTKTEIINLEPRQIQTSRGIKYQVKGVCKTCGRNVTIMVKGEPQENANNIGNPGLSEPARN